LGDVFLHIIPHFAEEAVIRKYQSLEEGNENYNIEFMNSFLTILLGVLIFFIADRVFGDILHAEHDSVHAHGHTHSRRGSLLHLSDSEDDTVDQTKSTKTAKKSSEGDKNEVRKRNVNQEKTDLKNLTKEVSKTQQAKTKVQAPAKKESIFVFLLADFMHNFVDGVALGVAFAFSIRVGISTLLAELFHELPHEIGDFAVLVKRGYSISAVLVTQLFTAFGALLGGLIGIYVGSIGDYLIGFTAGGFLYLALANMIPEILDLVKNKNIFDILLEMACMGLGIYLMYLIALAE